MHPCNKICLIQFFVILLLLLFYDVGNSAPTSEQGEMDAMAHDDE